MSKKAEEAIKIASKDNRLAPLAKAARPTKKGAWWMMKNSSGKKDIALTLMVVAFIFSLGLAGLGSIENLDLGDRSVSFREYNMGFATTVLAPIVGLYFGRRWTDTNRGLYDQQALHAKKSEDV